VDKLTHINNKELSLKLDFNFVSYSKITKSACLLIIGSLLASSVQAESKIRIDIDNVSVSDTKSPSKLEYEASLNNLALDAVDSLEVNPNSPSVASNEKLDISPLNNKQISTFSELAGRSSIELLNIETVESNLVSSGSNLALNNELSLPDLVKIGLNYSPVMQQAQASFESAEAQANIARAELLPSVSARHSEGPESSETKANGLDGHNYQVSSFRLTQPIFNAALIKDYMGTSKTQDAAELRMQANRETTALATIKATTDLAAARLILNFSDDLLAQLGKILSYLETRASAGAASQAELERARTRVFSARQTRIEQQTNYRNALLEVVRLTGVTPKKLELPSIAQYQKLPATNAELQQQVLDANYDLRSLRRDVDAQEDSVHKEYGKLMPVVGVSLERDQSTNVRGTQPIQTDNRALLVMTWNASLGGKELYAANQAKAELRKVKARLDEETQRTTRGVDADYALLQSASLRIKVAEEERRAATKVVSAVEEQLRSGRLSGTLLEALDACERLFLAKQHQAQSLAQQMQAQSQLLKRLGVLSDIQSQAKINLDTLSNSPSLEVNNDLSEIATDAITIR
jgi:outer membrane protein